MHHYPFHVGDYIKDTSHLTPMEDLAYRRLLDVYYDTEAPIPLETQMVSRRLRLDTEVVQTVLDEFFVSAEDGWHNARCDAEIAAYRAMSERNRLNGKLGGRPKKTQSVPSGNPVVTQSEPTGKPTRTKNQNQVNPQTPVGGFEVFWSAYPKKVGKGAAEKAWGKAKINGHVPDLMAALEAQKLSDQWRKDGGQYIPNPATWINQRRWEDGEPSRQPSADPMREFMRRTLA